MPDVIKQKVTAHVAARTALQREEGLTLLFDFNDYLSIDACRKAAMRFRMAFYTMRSRMRRSDDFNYDPLVCLVEKLPNGWQVSLKVETNLVAVMGKPILELTPDHQRWAALLSEATKCVRYGQPNLPCPFNAEEIAFFWDYNQQRAQAVYADLGWPLPGEEPLEPPPKAPSKWDNANV